MAAPTSALTGETSNNSSIDAKPFSLSPIKNHEKSDKYMREKIPRRIIQTDKSADLSLLAKAAAANLRLLNPDFEYLFFDDSQVEQFIDTEFPEYRAVF